MIKEDIEKQLAESLRELAVENVEIHLDHPNDSGHGDYSTNVALVAFNKKYQVSSIKYQVYKTPLELANAIVEILNTKYLIPNTDRIEVAKPGFINFWLSKDYLIGELEKLLRDDEKGALLATMKDEKIMVEFTDPNPFKEFHIGHLYSNTVGEAICRLFEASGALVRRVNYQGDVGLHVAKSLWGILTNFKFQISNFKLKEVNEKLAELEQKSLEERVKFLGQVYAMGAKAYEEDSKAKEEINILNKKVYEQDPEIQELHEKGRQWSLDYFERIYKILGTKFDGYYFESEVGKIGLELVREYTKKGIFEESQGAVIFPGKKYGLHNRVFINSLGLPTYEAKELGLAPKKYEDFPYDLSVIVTGNEIAEYFRVLLKALEQIRPDLAAKTRHVAHGMVRLPQGKMSSRTGNIVAGDWLLAQAKERIKKSFKDVGEKTSEFVAVAAIKFALLKSSIGKDIAFDFDESISLEGNSGPYLQYTYARTQSVIGKSTRVIPSAVEGSHTSKAVERPSLPAGRDSSTRPPAGVLAQNDSLNVEEISLLRSLHRFPEVVEEAATNYAPNLLCNYLFDLAQKFNLFYQKHRILGVKPLKQEEGKVQFRLAVTAGVGQTLKQGLYFLGISAPDRM